MMIPRDTMIRVLMRGRSGWSFGLPTLPNMTTGKRFTQRTKERAPEQRVLDARTRAMLNAVLSAPKGKALDVYLRTKG